MLGAVGADAHIGPPSVILSACGTIVKKHAVGADAHIGPPSVILSEFGIIVKKHIEHIGAACGDVVVDHYVIMPNHIHMMIAIQNKIISKDDGTMAKDDGAKDDGTMWASSPTDARIPGVVRTFKTLVAKECGFSFWQRSYYDRIIRSEEEYLRIRQYIEENPARWAEDEYFR